MPASASSRAVPPVESSATPRTASARAKSTMPVLSETESSARVTAAGMRRLPARVRSRKRTSREPALDQVVLRELGAERVAVHAEHLGSLRLVAVRPFEHRREQRPLDVRDHHVVDAVRRLAIQAAEVLVERALDAAADLVAAVETHRLLH